MAGLGTANWISKLRCPEGRLLKAEEESASSIFALLDGSLEQENQPATELSARGR